METTRIIISLLICSMAYVTFGCDMELITTVGRVVITNSAELNYAIRHVKPGSILMLRQGVYNGNFEAKTNGSEDNWIYIRPAYPKTENVTIIGDPGIDLPTLAISGSHYYLSNIHIINQGKGSVGLSLGESHTVVDNVTVTNAEIGIIFKGDGMIKNCKIHATRRGIMVATKNLVLLRNSITSESNVCIEVNQTYVYNYQGNTCNGRDKEIWYWGPKGKHVHYIVPFVIPYYSRAIEKQSEIYMER